MKINIASWSYKPSYAPISVKGQSEALLETDMQKNWMLLSVPDYLYPHSVYSALHCCETDLSQSAFFSGVQSETLPCFSAVCFCVGAESFLRNEFPCPTVSLSPVFLFYFFLPKMSCMHALLCLLHSKGSGRQKRPFWTSRCVCCSSRMRRRSTGWKTASPPCRQTGRRSWTGWYVLTWMHPLTPCSTKR